MIGKILSIAVLVLITAGILWLNTYPGTIRVDWQGYEIETTLAVFALVLVVFLFALYLLGKIWRSIATLPMRFGRRAQKRDREKGLFNLIEATTAIALEKNSRAKEKAYAVQRYLNTPLQHHILFEAALAEENFERAEQQIAKMNPFPEMRELAFYNQIRLCYSKGETAQAHTHLLELERTEPTAPYVLKNLLQTSVSLSLFDKALDVAQTMYKHNLLTSQEWNQYQAQLLYSLSQTQTQTQDIQQRLNALKKVHQIAPAFLPAALEMGKILKVQNKERLARKVLEATWEAAPHPGLLPLYLSVTAEDKTTALQRLAHLAPKHLESLLLLVQDAIEHEEWRKARAHLKSLEETYGLGPRALELMASIELKEKSDLDRYQHWMRQAIEKREAATWTCDNCCQTFESWQIMCESCGQIGCFVQKTEYTS